MASGRSATPTKAVFFRRNLAAFNRRGSLQLVDTFLDADVSVAWFVWIEQSTPSYYAWPKQTYLQSDSGSHSAQGTPDECHVESTGH